VRQQEGGAGCGHKQTPAQDHGKPGAMAGLPIGKKVHCSQTEPKDEEQAFARCPWIRTEEQEGADQNRFSERWYFGEQFAAGFAEGSGMEEGAGNTPEIAGMGFIAQFEAKLRVGTQKRHEVRRFGRVFFVFIDAHPHVIQADHQAGGVKSPGPEQAGGEDGAAVAVFLTFGPDFLGSGPIFKIAPILVVADVGNFLENEFGDESGLGMVLLVGGDQAVDLGVDRWERCQVCLDECFRREGVLYLQESAFQVGVEDENGEHNKEESFAGRALEAPPEAHLLDCFCWHGRIGQLCLNVVARSTIPTTQVGKRVAASALGPGS
jgi:hypothetical protein